MFYHKGHKGSTKNTKLDVDRALILCDLTCCRDFPILDDPIQMTNYFFPSLESMNSRISRASPTDTF